MKEALYKAAQIAKQASDLKPDTWVTVILDPNSVNSKSLRYEIYQKGEYLGDLPASYLKNFTTQQPTKEQS